MAEIIARFADGRLLVQEERVMEGQVASGGVASGDVATRIGLVRVVEKVLSIDTKISGYPGENVAAPLNEVSIDGDTITPILRRHDLFGLLSGELPASGYASQGALSGLVASGTGYMAQLLSGATSGKLTIIANVIGY